MYTCVYIHEVYIHACNVYTYKRYTHMHAMCRHTSIQANTHRHKIKINKAFKKKQGEGERGCSSVGKHMPCWCAELWISHHWKEQNTTQKVQRYSQGHISTRIQGLQYETRIQDLPYFKKNLPPEL